MRLRTLKFLIQTSPLERDSIISQKISQYHADSFGPSFLCRDGTCAKPVGSVANGWERAMAVLSPRLEVRGERVRCSQRNVQ